MGVNIQFFNNLPREIWLSIRDLVLLSASANELNIAPALWNSIFKSDRWLNIARTEFKCSPILLGCDLSAFRPHRASNRLYLALIANDYSGDLRFRKDELLESFQDGAQYDDNNYEVHLPSGIVVNIYEVITGFETAELPLEKLFSRERSGVHTEYCFYDKMVIGSLGPADIIGLRGPAHKWRDFKYGGAIRVPYEGKIKQYFIQAKGKRELWVAKRDDKSKLVSSFSKEPRNEPGFSY
jgi:hypothetical protein